MAPGVADIASSLLPERLDEIRQQYAIPSSMVMAVPGPTERARDPPSGFITVYEVHLKGGLRFPVPDEFHTIMAALQVPIARLQPNAVRYLVSLCVFLRCHGKRLSAQIVKIMFRFTHNLEWVTMTPRSEFAVMCGGNPDSTKRWKDKFFFVVTPEDWRIPNEWGDVASHYCSDPSKKERDSVRELLELITANLGSFHENKRNAWLLPENLAKAEWSPPPEGTASSASSGKKRKKLKKKAQISRTTAKPSKLSRPGESSKPPAKSSRPKAAIVEQSSSDEGDEPIAPLFKRPKTQAATPDVVSTIIRDIVEVSDAQSPGDEPIPDVPAEFTGEVSGFTDTRPRPFMRRAPRSKEKRVKSSLPLTPRLKWKQLLSRPRRRLLSSRTSQSKPFSPSPLLRRLGRL
ncbi:hypothetical protein Nepgr_000643 [Nepenthes gracilis]|uniref:Uncharacterized protein n=1 Tax=Nepenthes gracilis TaxID=150966 RepID=A0AAD3RWD0_NEPGR|nr:hypothetical protein Nepgr_000643 [Nepenthes gracilis]